MNSNYFYSNIVQTSKNKSFLEEMQSIAESIKQQVYVLSGPLIDGKYQYNDDSLIILLSSKKKIAFVTTSKMNDNFKDLCEDIIEDIGSVSDKYGYKEKIGRPRKWRDRLTGIYSLKEIDDVRAWFCNDIVINDTADFRTLDLLISLFIGSINDVKNITAEEPDNLLDKVKHKIQLFDGQQTRFIYEELDAEGKRITIQGLSGTGKTELLMHKLKDLYVKNEDAVFGFTCFNKILSRKLKERIPEFFNFMKVEQQIDWNKLLCVSAWGNYGNDRAAMEQDFAERKVIDYYVIYDIKESSKYKPTIVNEYVDNIILGTGEYKCEYEILLSCGDATRRLVIPVRTINMPMYDFITSIEDEIEDVMDRSSEENIFSNIIIDTGDYFLLDMFDEYGRTYKVEITGVYDFIKMIVSIRQIRCEFFPYEKK